MAFISTSHSKAQTNPFSLAKLAQVLKVRRQRRQLAQLDAAALADMGLTQSDVRAELQRSAWDVPAHWRG